MKRFILSLFLTICLLAFSNNLVGAQSYTTLNSQDLQIDKAWVVQNNNYTIPKSIIIVPVTAPSSTPDMDVLEWYRGTYYYQTTRYGLSSISFHYVISEDGVLINNDLSAVDTKIQVEGAAFEDPIMIAYFTHTGSLGFNPSARSRISNIILDIANKNSIPLENIAVQTVKFEEKESRKLTIQLGDIFVGWKNDLTQMIDEIRPNYFPVPRVYTITVEQVTLPSDELPVLSEFDVKIKIKNSGDFAIYPGSQSQLLFTVADKKSTKSKFFINEIWPSQTQMSIIPEGERLLPGESKEFAVKFKTPFDFGEVSEEFVINNANGDQLTGEPTKVTVKLKRPDEDVIEVLSTETGYLKVREKADINSEEVTRIVPGERYILLNSENGWYEIKLDDTRTGWVFSKYAKKL